MSQKKADGSNKTDVTSTMSFELKSRDQNRELRLTKIEQTRRGR